MWEVRKALVAKYNAAYPTTDKALNLRCAQATATSTPTAGRPVPGQPPLAAAGLRRLPAPAGCDQHARCPRRDAGRGPDAVRRRQPGRAVGRVRPPRHGQQRLHARRRLRRPHARLRLAEVDTRHREVQRDRPGRLSRSGRQGLHRRLRGPGDPRGRHRRPAPRCPPRRSSRPAPTRCCSSPRLRHDALHADGGAPASR